MKRSWTLAALVVTMSSACGDHTNLTAPSNGEAHLPRGTPVWDWGDIGIATGEPPGPVACDDFTCRVPTAAEAAKFEDAKQYIDMSNPVCSGPANYFYQQILAVGPTYSHVMNTDWNSPSSDTGGHIQNHSYPHVIFGVYFVANSGAFELAFLIMHEMYHHYNPGDLDDSNADYFAGICVGAA